MAFRLRLLLRCVRVLVACLVLGVAAAPSGAVPARVDGVAWVARPSSAGAEDRPRTAGPSAVQQDATPAPYGATPAPRSDLVAEGRRIAQPPARARTVSSRERIYLRHAALLC